VSLASEFVHADQGVREAAGELLSSAAQLLGVSRTTVEAWRTEGVLVPTQQRLRDEVTMEDDLGEVGGVLTRRLARMSLFDNAIGDASRAALPDSHQPRLSNPGSALSAQ
jgi:hypothetical protein